MTHLDQFIATPLSSVFDVKFRNISFLDPSVQPAEPGSPLFIACGGAVALTDSRFLVWRTSSVLLDLVEHDLASPSTHESAVRITFPGAIVPRPRITVLRDVDAISVVVATSRSTLHRILIPAASSGALLSALTVDRLHLPGSFVDGVCGGYAPASLDVCDDGRTVVLYSRDQGQASVVTFPELPGDGPARSSSVTLAEGGVLSRFWSSLVRTGQSGVVVAAAPVSAPGLVATLTEDLMLHVWSPARRVVIANVQMPVAGPPNWPAVRIVACPLGTANVIAVVCIPEYQGAAPMTPARLCFVEGAGDGHDARLVGVKQLDLEAGQSIVDIAVEGPRVWVLMRDSSECAHLLVGSASPARDWEMVQLEGFLNAHEGLEEFSDDPERTVADYLSTPGRIAPWAVAGALRAMLAECSRPAPAPANPAAVWKLLPEVVTIYARMLDEERGSASPSHIREAWSKLVELCHAEWIRSNIPQGIALVESFPALCVIRREGFSVIRMFDTAEQLLFQKKDAHPAVHAALEIADMIGVERLVPFDHSFFQPQSCCLPKMADGAISQCLADPQGEGLREKLEKEIRSTGSLWESLEEVEARLETPPSSGSIEGSQPFDSPIGAAAVVSATSQIAEARYVVARALFLLVAVATHSEMPGHPSKETLSLRPGHFPRLRRILKRNWLAVWACRLRPGAETDPDASVIESLDAMHISPQRTRGDAATVFSSFYLEAEKKFPGSWEQICPLVFDFIHKDLDFSAVDKAAAFAEHLLANGQARTALEFVRLADESKGASLQHIAGRAHLAVGEFGRAVDRFCAASISIESERYLHEWAKPQSEEETDMGDSDQPRGSGVALYFKRCIHALEAKKLHPEVIRCARFALTVVLEQGAVADLWSIIFNHAIEVSDFELAYVAALSNPYIQRTESNLSQFVTTALLYRAKEELVSRPFPGFTTFVGNAIQEQARLQDVHTPGELCFYDVLFSFFSARANHRAAAQAMLEYGQRLGSESHRNSLDTLEREQRAYLCALNSIGLVRPESQWLYAEDISQKHRLWAPSSPKRGRDEHEQAPQAHETGSSSADAEPRLRDRVITKQDLEKLCTLASARVRLAQHFVERDMPLSVVSFPVETLQLLIQESLFDTAFTLAVSHGLNVEPVFIALARRRALGEAGTAELIDGIADSDVALQRYLSQHGTREHYRAVADVTLFVQPGALLPSWLSGKLEEIYPTGLLRVYMHHQLLELAAQAAVSVLCRPRPTPGTADPQEVPYSLVDTLVSLLRARPELAKCLADVVQSIESHRTNMLR